MNAPEDVEPRPDEEAEGASKPEDWWDGMTDQEVENWLEGSD